MEISVVGVDLSKSFLQVHAATRGGAKVHSRRVSLKDSMKYFSYKAIRDRARGVWE
jgi:hypothetical protein